MSSSTAAGFLTHSNAPFRSSIAAFTFPLDQDLEEPALDFETGLMDERLDLVGEMLVLLWHGQRHPQRQLERECPTVSVDGAEGDGSLKAVGGTHGVSPYRYDGGCILRAFLSIGQGKTLPRSGIARKTLSPILCIPPIVAHQLASARNFFQESRIDCVSGAQYPWAAVL